MFGPNKSTNQPRPRLCVHIRFKGGAVESLTLPLPKNAWRKRLTHPDVVARIELLLQQHDEVETAEQLNAEGLRTGAGSPFDEASVRWVRYSHGLKNPTEHLREAGKLTVREVAARLGLREATVRSWTKQGRLRAARHGRKPIWLVDPIDEQPEGIRELASRHAQPTDLSGHSDASTPTDRLNRWRDEVQPIQQQLRDAGKLSTREIAVRLGISMGTAYNWARAGRLRGKHCSDATRARWAFDPIDQQPEPIRRLAAKRATMPKRRGLLSDAATGQGAV